MPPTLLGADDAGGALGVRVRLRRVRGDSTLDGSVVSLMSLVVLGFAAFRQSSNASSRGSCKVPLAIEVTRLVTTWLTSALRSRGAGEDAPSSSSSESSSTDSTATVAFVSFGRPPLGTPTARTSSSRLHHLREPVDHTACELRIQAHRLDRDVWALRRRNGCRGFFWMHEHVAGLPASERTRALVEQVQAKSSARSAELSPEILHVRIDREDQGQTIAAVNDFWCSLGLDPSHTPRGGGTRNLERLALQVERKLGHVVTFRWRDADRDTSSRHSIASIDSFHSL